MRSGVQRSVAAIGAAACVALGLAVVPAAQADRAPAAGGTVTVRGLAFPEGRAMRLGFVGCESLYERTPESPQAMIGTGPATAPTGERSLRYDLVGGNAVGALSYVSSVAGTLSAGLTAYAEQGTTGVVYAGYQEPADRRTGRVWFGRAEVTVPAGRWTSIEATELTYTWSKWDMYTQAPVASAPTAPDGTLADMVVRHRGDGAGFLMTGLGCDGNEFAMDALHLETAGTATTYDLEGLATSLSMQAPPVRRVAAGQPVTLTGSLVDSSGAPLSGVTMMLESRAAGAARWQVEQVVEVQGTSVSVEVLPETGTTYRWRFADRPMAEGSVSAPLHLEVAAAASPESTPSPTSGPTEAPTSTPTSPASTPTTKPTKSPSSSPTKGPTKSPTSSAVPSDATSGSASSGSASSGTASSGSASSPSGVPSSTPTAAATTPVG